MLTSIADKDNVVKGLTGGADDYLTKPFHLEELLARVKVGLRLIELHRQLEEKNRLLELKGFADILQANTRSSDISGRIGGEEFLHVLMYAEEAHMPRIVERTRAKLNAKTFFRRR